METTITQYYELVLQREPTDAEVATWVAFIDDGVLSLDQVLEGIVGLAETQNEVVPIVQAYQAIYGRVPDAEGLNYWVGVYRDNLDLNDPATPTINEAMVAVLGAFVDEATEEFAELYGEDPSAAQFVNAAYTNVLNRDPDTSGLLFWINRYNEVLDEQGGDALQTRAIILEQFVSSVEYAEASSTAVANFLTAAAREEAGAYEGTLWSKDPDAPTPTEGETFTLTASDDDITGTANDDTFNAPLSAAGVQTLQEFDTLDGAGGTNTLNATLNTANIALDGVIENIQNLYFRAVDNVPTVNLADVDGVEQVWADRLLDNLTVNNIGNQVTLGAIRGSGNNFTAVYAAGAVGDAVDDDDKFTQAVALENANITLTLNDIDGFRANADVDDVELAFDLTGDNTVELAGAIIGPNGVTSITSTGSGSLSLDLGILDANAAELEIALGDGDNTVTVVAANLGGDVDFDLGGGDNTLVLEGVSDGFDITGVDATGDYAGVTTLAFANGGAAIVLGAADGVIDLEAFGEVSSVAFKEDVDLDGRDLVFQNADEAVTVTFEEDLLATGGGALVFEDDVESITLNLEGDTGIGGAPVTLTAGAGADTSLESLVINAEGDAFINLGAGGFELNALTSIDLSGSDADATLTIDGDAGMGDAAARVTITVGESNLTYSVTDDRAETFKFVGDDIGDITINGDNFDPTNVVGDRLDFSEFANVTSIDNLEFSASGADLLITADDDEFEGTITLLGLAGQADDVIDNIFFG